MGMRHLIVTQDGTQKVTGIITRHDFYESKENWEQELEEQKEQKQKNAGKQGGRQMTTFS